MSVKSMSVMSMWTCMWARRRIQRYLDSDPSAPLSTAEAHRLREHLRTCDKCARIEQEYRGLTRALAGWSAAYGPDPVAVARVRLRAERIIGEDAS